MLQYVLILLPLAYMVVYVVWYILKSRRKWLKKKFLKNRTFHPLNAVLREDSSVFPSVTRSELHVDNISEQEEDAALFARAEATNQFRSSPGWELKSMTTLPLRLDHTGLAFQGRRAPLLELQAVKAMGAYAK